jgi:hypothetical protein
MPFYQSISDADLSARYHLKAVGVSNTPNRQPTKPPNRNGGNWQRNGIRWQIRPPYCQSTLRGPISSDSSATHIYFEN